MHKNWRNIGTVSGWTGISRILGLIRDALVYALLGTSAVSAGFIIAFTLPNLFRRLLGEGALGSATMPVLARELEASGREAFDRLLSRILSLLAIGLLAIWVAAELIFLAGGAWTGTGSRFYWAFRYSSLVFTYIGPVCLAAILTTGLNLLGRFAVPAFTPVALNLSIIGGGILAMLLHGGMRQSPDPATAGWYFSAGVAIGGFLQLALTALNLRQLGWRFRFDPKPTPAVREVWALFLPGVAGAAITQVNLLTSRLLALSLGSAPVAYLYLAARLIELPLGLYAIAVTSVYFPRLSRDAASNDLPALEVTFREGLQRILWITLPAALGLILLAGPILRVLFEWGRFGPVDTTATATLLGIYAIALPAYAIGTLTTRALHARRNMRAPLRIAGWNFAINLGAGIALMIPLGVIGLAIGNTLAAWIQTTLLVRALEREFAAAGHPTPPLLKGSLPRSTVLATLVMGTLVGLLQWTASNPNGAGDATSRWREAATLAIQIGIGLGIYFGTIRACQWFNRDRKRDA